MPAESSTLSNTPVAFHWTLWTVPLISSVPSTLYPISRSAVSLAVLLELVSVGLLGFLVGFGVGNYAAWALANIIGWDLIIPWSQVGIYAAVILGSVTVAALIPSYTAARIPPSEALRYTG